MEPLEVYNANYKLIQTIYSSRLKIQILLSVARNPKTLSELREITGSTSQAIIPKIRRLEGLSLIEQVNHRYAITPVGRILVTKIEEFVMTIGEIMKHREFWATHDIEGIPRPFLDQIGDLISSDVKFDTTDDMFHVYSHFIAILQQAGYIHGISSVMSPQIADVLAERIIASIPVELIVSRNVGEALTQEPFLSKIQQLKPYQNFRVWMIDEPLHLGITVTDKYLSLGLNNRVNAVYDSSADMYSSDPQARDWAERLFQYYKNNATLMKLE
ncbi:MAG: transcriptional regulator FilR1 domain-containing protein [Methanoregula sp.]